MAAGKSISLFLVFLASTTVFSYSYVREASGRRLFGGYRIVPKTCKPTIPSRVKSNEPAICMFNYECTRRNGEVVGACMDGFLFGACCQLPSKSSINDGLEKITSMSDILNQHEIDHVPDIPILLNPDGTPVGMKIPQNDDTNKEGSSSVSKRPTTEGTIYTKISTFGASSTTSKPILGPSYSMDSVENAEKPQIPVQPDLSNLEQNFSALLDQQSILDDLSLPSLLSHTDSNNYIQDHQENSPVNPVITLLSPDEILQIADPVDQLPALFSQGFGQSNYSSADTILLNKNGSVLNEAHNPDDLFKPTAQTIAHSTEKNRVTQSFGTSEKGGVTESGASTENKKKVTLDANHRDTSTTQWVRFPEQQRPSSINSMTTFGGSFGGFPTTKLPMLTQMYGNSQGIATVSPESLSTMFDKFEKISTIEERVSTKNVEALYSPGQRTTTPMSTLSDKKDDLVRVPTITYDAPSGNKKHDIVDKEEIAINHIISILNDTTPGSDNSVTVQAPSSPIHTWVSIDELSKPTLIRLSSPRPTPPTSVATQSFPYTFYKPNQPTNYYNYETVPTETSYSSHSTSNTYPPRPSTQTNFGSSQSNFGYSTRPTTNPPAPTVIVLGPLGTEYTTETTEKSVVTRKPTTEPVRLSSTAVRPTVGSIRPSSVSTKKPSVSTTITHNISTVISNVATNNNHVVSSSFISVNLKDGSTSKPTVSTAISTEAVSDEESEERITTKKPVVWTTLSSWSDKPLFQLKPSTSTFRWPEENPTASDSVIFGNSESQGFKATTSTPPCDDETAAPDDLINFPPVRNPNLNISAPISQQEKPIMMQIFNDTRYPDVDIISENDIPTPTFIEDDVLTNKVDAFVNKLVESLQGNFQDLKDVVYKRNGTTTTSPTTVTKRPTVTRKPTQKPTQTAKPPNTTTRRPVTTRRPATRPASSKPTSEKPPRTSKPTTSKPRPTTSYGVTTKKPQVTTKRSKPTKKPTTTTTRSTEALLFEEEATSPLTTVEDVNASSQATPTVDFRNQCGVRPLAKSGRIVGGKAASFGKWPWQVLVREATWLGLFTKNKCGGVLITDKYVITAAHCQPGFLASLVAVFGEFDLSGELEDKRSMTRNVRRVIVNRGYDPATFESDLALLELESPVQFDEHIVPICMPDDNIDFTGRMATVTGWGRLKYNGGVPFLLQEVQVPIIKNSVCQEMFQIAGHSKLIVDSFLCAGYADGQKDSCEGDSGGPLVMQRPDGRWFLVGTVSHGIKCASPFLPGVYMRINYFKPWLHSVTGV